MSTPSIDPFFSEPDKLTDFNLKATVLKYVAYWQWFTISMIAALGVAYFFMNTQNPEYAIRTSIMIKDEKKGLGQDELMKQLDIFGSNKVVENEIEVLKSYTLMEKVIKDLNLNIVYSHVDGLRQVDLYKQSPIIIDLIQPNDAIYAEPLEVKILNKTSVEVNEKEFPLNKIIKTQYGIIRFTTTGSNPAITHLTVAVKPLNAQVEKYLSIINIEAASKMSSVLNISLSTPVPQKGKDLLNKLVEEYNIASIADKNEVARITLDFIEERLKLISGDLSTVEKNVEDFKTREGITDISAESKLFLESVKENDAQLNQVKIQQSVLNNIADYVRGKANGSNTVPATLGISDPNLLKTIEQLNELELKRKSAVKLVRSDNPIIIGYDEQIQSLKLSLKDILITLNNSLNITRAKLENENARMEAVIRTVPRKERQLVDISRQQAIKNNLYLFLLQKREETALSYASTVPDSRTIDTARSSTKPVKIISRNIYLLFALLGLLFPVVVIYIIELLNDKITTRKEIERQTQAPIMGEISLSEQNSLITSKNNRSVLAEQTRSLRTSLSFLAPKTKLKSLLFTSSISGEGKSFVSLNLGASLSLANKKTIILELDLRKPKLHKYLNLNNSTGLSNYLAGYTSLNEIIQKVPGHDNYFIITAGPLPPNPAELLMFGSLTELFIQLRKDFDYIIIDAPPIGLVTDAQILAEQADATLFVIRHNYTPKLQLKRLNELFKERRFKNFGLVFNAINESARYGSEYGYGYGYGNGYYIGNNTVESRTEKVRA
ncbi:GumC family protein [Solitalea canadensis]|uniref:non-specific protein-tyrosine kinase n=1 Tax=Solitalea canadensis (strain ATCC 29591 / DSM 3403 / JCM 21819 / LMG 8368 / NBRC 15130 / NCIMB 12057 / USAM 9D) TaxID=929556 RepID=H8KS95_SOLCM|nr:tyrosine-protein kinase family protein [Solitalea canadensis]AFD08003.1 capsular exopolysaccharide biosynthesis protein [Solitalea canadensis DSM 3403]